MTYDDYDADAAERRFDHDMGQLERIQELESLARDMYAVIGVHEQHWRDDGHFTAHENFERRMAALGLIGDDAE